MVSIALDIEIQKDVFLLFSSVAPMLLSQQCAGRVLKKTHHLSYSVYKHEAIDVADSSSMQDACYMNFVMDLAHRGSVVGHQSTESEGMRFYSWWGLRISSLLRSWQDEKHVSQKIK